MRVLADRPALQRFLTSLAAGVTAIGIVNLLRWLRAPVVDRSRD
jgi:hypothetical protein